METVEESPSRRLRQFRCVYPGCPSARTNKRNNIERHVWTQHLRIKLKMPEVRYFARTFKHYVDPYVQEVKDGRIRQRGRRAKCGPAKINTGLLPQAVAGQNSVESREYDGDEASGRSDADTSGDSMGESDHDESYTGEESAHGSPVFSGRRSQGYVKAHAGYDTPGSITASNSIPGSRRGSLPENRVHHVQRYQFHHYQHKDHQRPPAARKSPLQQIHRTSSAPVAAHEHSSDNSRSSSNLSQHSDTSEAPTITMYGQKMPLPPVGSSLVPIPLDDARPSQSLAQSPNANMPPHRPAAKYHHHTPFSGPLAPLLLALQTIDAAECAAARNLVTSPQAPISKDIQEERHGRLPESSRKHYDELDSMWRPWERFTANSMVPR